MGEIALTLNLFLLYYFLAFCGAAAVGCSITFVVMHHYGVLL